MKAIINILVANARLSKLGGSETFTYTLIEELRSRENIHVEYFTFEKGLVSTKIENELGVKFKSLKRYDLILANHNTCVTELFSLGYVIQTCHGIFPILEQPSYLADTHVAISQEVQNYLISLGFSNKIIYNGINLSRFKEFKPINLKLKTVLSLCHSQEANASIKSVCDDLNLSYLEAYKYQDSVWDIERVINEADMVVGLGRSAYEAMACARPVVVYDSRHYFESCGDGYIKNKLGLSLLNNCSGRYFKIKYNHSSLKDEFLKYNASDGIYLRDVASREFNISKNVDQYLEYWQVSKKSEKINRRRQFKKAIRTIIGKKLTLLVFKKMNNKK
ncbi:glycosyltransferase [Formosa sp. 3Alg 14/1]|uniref:glycosyltransferase n=1 Tax=Formosa sp. 3Alg 14/1 TaxID=3382190 RepID=UPI0039BEA259